MSGMTVDEAMHSALAAHHGGDHGRSVDLTRAVLEVQPNHAEARHLLGAALFMGGQRAAGIEEVKRARRLSPDHPMFIGTLADMLLQADEAEAALGIIRGGLAREPGSVTMWRRYARALHMLGEEEARAAAVARMVDLKGTGAS